MGRIRKKLVPNDGIEVFEIRIVRYIDREGSNYVVAHASTPDEKSVEVELHDFLGAVESAKQAWIEKHREETK